MKENFNYSEKELNDLIKKEPKFKPYVENFGILLRAVNENIFESIIEAVISQQISGKVAQVIYNRLIEKIKVVKPENLLLLTDEEYKTIGLGKQKSGYIKSISNSFLNGEIKEENLKFLDDKDVIEELIKLKGVGAWTAEMLLIFSLKRKNVLSAKDLGIRKGLMKLYEKNSLEEINVSFIEECKNKFSPLNTIASFYLWEIASLK